MIDEHAVTNLVLYADNDSELHTKVRVPYLLNMQRRMKKGTYDAKKGVKLWEYYAERAARKYAREFGSSEKDWSKIFSKATRHKASEHFEREARRELRGR